MIRGATIVVLLVAVAVLCDRVAREENQRYALEQDFCRTLGQLDSNCLATVQTRSAWGWQLYNGVINQLPQVAWTADPTPRP